MGNAVQAARTLVEGLTSTTDALGFLLVAPPVSLFRYGLLPYMVAPWKLWILEQWPGPDTYTVPALVNYLHRQFLASERTQIVEVQVTDAKKHLTRPHTARLALTEFGHRPKRPTDTHAWSLVLPSSGRSRARC